MESVAPGGKKGYPEGLPEDAMNYPGNSSEPDPYSQPRPRPHPGAPNYHGHGTQPYPQQPVYYPQPQPQFFPRQKPLSGLALGSLVTGIASVFFFPLGLISCLVGLGIGIRALRYTSRDGGTHRGRGIAVAGIWTNVGVFVFTGVAIFGFVMLVKHTSDMQSYPHYVQEDWEGQRLQDAKEDSRLIASRLETYYLRNDRSFGPGGPHLSYDEQTPVRGALGISHLVKGYELRTWQNEFDLVIENEHTARILHLPTGHEHEVDMQWR
jgi:hypothetical protein